MKAWELEEGKIYKRIDTNSFYKIINGDLYHFNNVLNHSEKSLMEYNLVRHINFEEVKREIDWSKVPKWTKVQVKDYAECIWKNAYFIGINNNTYYPYSVTFCDEFTYRKHFSDKCSLIRLRPSVTPQEDWFTYE